MDKHLCKVSINGESFYIFTNMSSSLGKFKDTSTDKMDYFDVSLSNGKEMYCGKVSVTDVLKMASLVDIEEDRYYNTLKQCLCNADGNSSTQFTYHMIENDDSSLKFVWKQVLDEEMKFQLGSMLLQKEDNPALKTLDIFAFLSQQLNVLTDEVTNLTNKNRNLELEKKGMTKRLEGYVLTKESLEQDLFTKFSLVLNEKKARIRELKEKVDNGKGDNHERIEKRKREERSDGEDTNALHSNGDTDTDEEKERNAKMKIDTNTVEKDNNPDIILEGNIVDDKEDVPKKTKKRVRKSKPKTSVHSILPRTSSLPRPPKQSSETSTSVPKKVKSKETEDDLLDQLMF